MAAENPPNEMPGSSAPTEPLDSFLGTVLNDRYLIQDKLGAGGFGVVYRALDKKLHEKPVVIKILLERSQHKEYFEKKFRQESEALARIRHPGVVGISDLGATADGKPFIVMDFVDGVTLRSAMHKTGMEFARAAGILREVCNALGAAHDQGVCHRDLKPENILLRNLGRGEERPVIIDFGIAGVKDSRISGEQHSEVAGTYPYMAPEQFTGHAVTQSDIYSVGVIAYELVTGRRPFLAETPVQQFMQQQSGVAVKPVELRPDLPANAQDVILKALAFDVKDRYQQATEFGEEFASALSAPVLNSASQSVGKQPAHREDRAPGDPEIASVLFLDIVGFSRKSMEEQDRCKQRLQQIVRETSEFQTAAPVKRDTGDGMVLVFWSDFQAPIRCAISICRGLRAAPEIQLRIGVHAGPIYRRPDINDELNVIGGGINVAQRVMDSGDSGHILVSQTYAEMLAQFSEWREHLHDLGEHPVKHGDIVHLFNFYTKDCGNPAKPIKLRPQSSLRRSVIAAAGVVLLAGVGWGLKTTGFFAGESGTKKTGSEIPAAIAPSRTLNYYIIVQKYRNGKSYDEPFRLGREMIFESGWRLRFVFGSAEAGYLYLLNEGPDGLTVVSPASFDGEGAELRANENREETIELGGRKGTEKLWIVWAKNRVPALEKIMQPWMNAKAMGRIEDPIQSRLASELLTQNADSTVHIEEDKTNKISKVETKRDIVAVPLSLEHQ